MAEDQKYYQQLTEKIARSGGLETDLRQFHDPIYRTVMVGKFANGGKKKGGFWGLAVLLVIIFWLFGPFLVVLITSLLEWLRAIL